MMKKTRYVLIGSYMIQGYFNEIGLLLIECLHVTKDECRLFNERNYSQLVRLCDDGKFTRMMRNEMALGHVSESALL
jgi:hypothetical protein